MIKAVDARAFITISDVSEIIGNHIKKKADLPAPDPGSKETATTEQS